ncbi:MAG: hypothetical protein ACM335_00735 [Deltaproteobacteria bacterium]
MLRENTASLRREDGDLSPITGFSCWALGYLDGRFKRVGCLLHPGQNQGEDLRYRVDYGGKCSRESCVEAQIFKLLAPEARAFWLRLSDGLDSFAYSSRTLNPLFLILGWGSPLLKLVALAERERDMRAKSILETYTFFQTDLPARANAYLLNAVVINRLEIVSTIDSPSPRPLPQAGGGGKGEGASAWQHDYATLNNFEHLDLLKDARFRNRFEHLSHRLSKRISLETSSSSAPPYVHLLPMDPDFLNFLRLSSGVVRATEEEALSLKELTDQELARFRSGLL